MDARAPPRAAFVFGAYRLDAARGVLTHEGAPIVLTPRVLETLVYLLENPGRVVSKDEMLHALWPGRIADETNLSQAISALRKALADGSGGDRLIVTAPGRGYRFTAEVSVEPAGPSSWSGSEWPPTVKTSAPARPGQRRAMFIPLAAGVTSLVIAASIGLLMARQSVSRLPLDRTGVVLADFQNFTREPVFDHILRQALEIDLAQSPFLQVTPRTKIAETLDLMGRRKDDPLTETLARTVCARTNGGAVIAGTIAALGSRYQLALTASDCVTGRILDEDQQGAQTKEDIPRAVDRLAARTRRKLGESQASIGRFNVPLLPERTASFEALRAYSEGVWLVDHGQSPDAMPMFRHAVELDPNFTAAYEALAIAYGNNRQREAAAAATTKAYTLRDNVSERRRLHIAVIYAHDVTKDLDAERENLRLWTRLYPADTTPWIILANLDSLIGQHQEAVDAAKQALALRDDAETGYAILIRARTRAGQFAGAQAAGDRAIAKGLAGQNTHTLLMILAYARHDMAGVQSQLDWARGKSAEPGMLFWAAKIALAEGQVKRAAALSDKAVALGKSQGLTYQDQAAQALMLAEFGLTDQARALLDGASPAVDLPDFLHATALIGDPSRAQTELARALAKSPSDTLLLRYYGPLVRSALLLRSGQAATAARALDPGAPYQLSDFDLLYARGQALLAAKDAAAAGAFRTILTNPGLGPDPEYPLARLGLARALRLTGDLAASRRAYQAFFAGWTDADSDLPVLRQAKAEYAGLPTA